MTQLIKMVIKCLQFIISFHNLILPNQVEAH